MTAIVVWILYAVALGASALAWVGLYLHWKTEPHPVATPCAVLMATAAPLYACAAFAHVEFVAPEPPFDYTLERWGLLIALLGIIAGFARGRPSTWYLWVAIGSSSWIFLLFLLASMTM